MTNDTLSNIALSVVTMRQLADDLDSAVKRVPSKFKKHSQKEMIEILLDMGEEVVKRESRQ